MARRLLLNRTLGSPHTSQHPKVWGSSLYDSGLTGDLGFGTCRQFGARAFCPQAQLTKSHRREHKREHQGKLHSPKQNSPRPTSTVDRRHREHSRVWIHCPIRIKQKRPVQPEHTHLEKNQKCPTMPHYCSTRKHQAVPLGMASKFNPDGATSYKDTEVQGV